MTAPLPRNKNAHFAWAMIQAGFLVTLGIFLHLCLTQATHHFLLLGILSAATGTLGAMAIIVPASLLLVLPLHWLDRMKRLPGWLSPRLIRIVAMVLLSAAILSGIYRTLPKTRYSDHIGLVPDHISDIRVAGYSKFPSSEWLFSFHADGENADLIVSMLALTRDHSVDPRKLLARNHAFSKASVNTEFDIPVSGNLECYSLETPANTKSGTWITLAVERSTNRVWLHKSTWGLDEYYSPSQPQSTF